MRDVASRRILIKRVRGFERRVSSIGTDISCFVLEAAWELNAQHRRGK